MTRATRIIMLALRLRRRGVIDEKRCDEICERADMSAPRFPESLSDLVARYDELQGELQECHEERAAFGLSDWRAALMESLAQDSETARAAIAAYCARFGVANPIEARNAQ